MPCAKNLSLAAGVGMADRIDANRHDMDFTSLLRIYAFLLLAGWLATIVRALRALRSIHRFPRDTDAVDDGGGTDIGSAPLLSVIIPFRNEAASLAATAEPFLDASLPIELILIDDNSDDGSGSIADRLAEHSQVIVLRPGEPPPDWLGKPWACHHGAAAARGRFLLFMDADVEISRTLLPRLLAYLRSRRPPHLVLFPYVRTRGILESSYMTLFVFLFLFRFDPHAAARRGRRGHVGVGAFNLVRGDVYARFGGYASLRLAVADDVMLGQRVKEIGEHTVTFRAPDAVRVRWREGFRDTLRGTRRSLFAGTGFSRFWLLIAFGGTFGGIIAPFLLLTMDDPFVRLPAAVSALLCVTIPALLRGRSRHRMMGGLLFPLQAIVFLGVYIASAADTLLGKTLRWRGRSYDLRMLRKWHAARSPAGPSGGTPAD